MGKDYMSAMRRARQLDSWSEAEHLIDSLITEAGLSSEAEIQARRDYGRKAAEIMNSKGKLGKPV